MKVIGIDPSITATGVVGVAGAMGWVFGGPAALGDHRLRIIHQGVLDVCIAQTPHLAVLEDAPGNTQGSGVLGMVQGVVRLALAMAGVPYGVVVPASLKKYATGNGRANKADMRMALFKRTGIDEPDDNLVDAHWLRHAGLDALGAPVLILPADQRASLGRMRWPDVVPRPVRG